MPFCVRARPTAGGVRCCRYSFRFSTVDAALSPTSSRFSSQPVVGRWVGAADGQRPQHGQGRSPQGQPQYGQGTLVIDAHLP
jgi:hypothetical protein